MKLTHVEGAILVGGASRRMGQDKARIDWAGAPLVQRVADALESCLERVRLVIRPGTEPPLALPYIEDESAARAPIVGIHAALRACEASAVLVVPCDLPELDPRVLLALLALAPIEAEFDVVAPRTARGFEPLLAVYRPRILPEVERRIRAGELGLQKLLAGVNTLAVPEADLRSFDPELVSLRNVNRPEDLYA